MRVTLLTSGTRGDVQPFIALGQELKKRGHEVRCTTHGDFEPLAQEAGIEFRPLPGSALELFKNPKVIAGLRKGHSTFRVGRQLERPSRATLTAMVRAIITGCEGADL